MYAHRQLIIVIRLGETIILREDTMVVAKKAPEGPGNRDFGEPEVKERKILFRRSRSLSIYSP